jgi:hypothetical protein
VAHLQPEIVTLVVLRWLVADSGKPCAMLLSLSAG